MESAKSTPTHLKVSEQMKHAIEDEKEENVERRFGQKRTNSGAETYANE